MRYLVSYRALAKMKWDITPLIESKTKNLLKLTVETRDLNFYNFEVANNQIAIIDVF